MKKSTIVEIISALFILLFVYTATNKLFENASFINTLSKSPLIGNFADLMAIGLPVTELIIAFLLFLPRTRLIGLYASLALMSVFTIYIAYMIAFTPKLPCSCGGVLKQMSWGQHLLFNIAFILLAVWGIILYRRNKNFEVAQATAFHLKRKYSI